MMPMQLRQFELRHAIASGGMGTVYRAFDTMLEREVAVKLMQREIAEDQETLDQFYKEARSCASLNHTNIIHIYTFDEYDGQLFLAMELADHGSLDGRIDKETQIPELDVLDIGVGIASALDSALKKGFLHRDIKPANILFNAQGEAKLVDFGLARDADADAEEGATIWGTPYYIAPEKINREKESFLADMYSLAGTLYHALTGHVPFEAPTIDEVVVAHVHTPLTPPNHVVEHLTQPTSDAICRAMEKNPAHRFQSYDEFVMALTSARSQYLINHFNNQPAGGAAAGQPAQGKSWWRR
jgi:serine/threonine protein kinase